MLRTLDEAELSLVRVYPGSAKRESERSQGAGAQWAPLAKREALTESADEPNPVASTKKDIRMDVLF